MKVLSNDQFLALTEALLTDGADNSTVTIFSATDGESTKDAVGYGLETLERGKYLIVYDTIDEDDNRFPALYDFINTIEMSQYDILTSLEDNDETCVVIFKVREG